MLPSVPKLNNLFEIDISPSCFCEEGLHFIQFDIRIFPALVANLIWPDILQNMKESSHIK